MEADEDFIPRSARVGFRFNTTRVVEQSTEFQALKAEAEEIIRNNKKSTKREMHFGCKTGSGGHEKGTIHGFV